MGRVQDKVAVVTGGASGIGASTSRLLAAEGASVVVADIDEEAAEKHAETLRAEGGRALAVRADLGSEADLRELFARTEAEFGGLDILHNNAAALGAVARDLPIHETDPDVWDETFHTTVTGTVVATREAVPLMLRRGGGAIVNTASVAAHLGEPGPPAYGVSKAAIVALTRQTAVVYGKRGIRANAISPGHIQTPAMLAYWPADKRERILAHYPARRLGLPEDIAAAVLFLASSDAAFVNGQVLTVDGGYTAHTPIFADLGVEL